MGILWLLRLLVLKHAAVVAETARCALRWRMSFPDKKMSAPLAATGETHKDKTPVQTRAELIEICQRALDR